MAENGEQEQLPLFDHKPTAEALGAIGSLVGKDVLLVTSERLDSQDEVYEMERAYQALQFIKNAYALRDLTPLQRALAPLNRPMHAVNHIGNQFAVKLVPCFMAPDPDQGLGAFKELPAHTTDEELVLLANDDQFRKMHRDLHDFLDENDEDIFRSAAERLEPKTVKGNPNIGQITANDRYQFNGQETVRSLDNQLKYGVRVEIGETGIEIIKSAVEQAGSGVLPVLEVIKNELLLGVNGFMSSKIALAVHDAMDHVWTYMVADRSGLFAKFEALFDSIGNPEKTDIFKREGEVVASIAFGVRYWATIEHGFVPLINVHDLLTHMDTLFDNGLLGEVHMNAYRILRQLSKNPASREAQSLGFVFSNYLVELNEQRRKHGKIKQKDLHSKKVVGELDPMGPDYLAFFIELHHQLLDSSNKHRDNLLRFHILLEEYLCAIGSGKLNRDEALTVKVQDLPSIDFSNTNLPPTRIQWMARNYGFSAVKDSVL